MSMVSVRYFKCECAGCQREFVRSHGSLQELIDDVEASDWWYSQPSEVAICESCFKTISSLRHVLGAVFDIFQQADMESYSRDLAAEKKKVLERDQYVESLRADSRFETAFKAKAESEIPF